MIVSTIGKKIEIKEFGINNDRISIRSNEGMVTIDNKFLAVKDDIYFLNMFTVLPLNIFLYSNIKSFIVDYNKGFKRNKFKESKVFILSSSNIKFLFDYLVYNKLERKSKIYFTINITKEVIIEDLTLYLSLLDKCNFIISKKNDIYIINKNQEIIYSFSLEKFNFSGLKSNLHINTKRDSSFFIYYNKVNLL